jgi:hypothetical protein
MRNATQTGSNMFSLTKSLTIDNLTLRFRPSDQRVVQSNRHTYIKPSTIGWQLCCQWKDGLTSWENLAHFKESHPLETTEYAMTQGIDHEPAFNWWVLHFFLEV